MVIDSGGFVLSTGVGGVSCDELSRCRGVLLVKMSVKSLKRQGQI